MNPDNVFSEIPKQLANELVEEIACAEGVRIERIISTGHASPPGFWYEQDSDEWVLLLKGAARLLFEDDATPVSLAPGDHLLIPARRRHRVEWTHPDQPTIWLAVWPGKETP
jgi:cupin 2 domain-containing protein